MMSQNRWILLWLSGVIVAGLVSCTSQPPLPPAEASATPRLQAPTVAVITSTPSQGPARSPGVQPSPSAASTRQWTAVPIAPAQIITQEKAMSGGTSVPIPVDPGSQPFVRLAQEDLAKRLSVPADQIEVVEVRDVVWPDKGLGCPQPGMAYTQVQVDGQLIRLRAGGRLYEYHSGGGRPPFLCENNQ